MPLPVANREYLISCFNHGDIPTEQDFIRLINSAINTNDDNLKKESNSPLQIGNASTDALQKMIEFFRGAVSGSAAWSVGLSARINRPGFAVMQGNTDRLFIQEGTGNIGIGNDDPKMSLQASSNSLYSSPAIGGYKDGKNNHNGWLYMHVVSNVNFNHAIIWDDKRSLTFGVETNMGVGVRDLVRITHEGRVGIGTIGPRHPLEVDKSFEGDYVARFGNSAQGGATVWLARPGYGAHIDAGTNASAGTYALAVNKGAENYLFVRGDGNVGVGTTGPTSKLTIDGGTLYSSDIGNRRGLVELVKYIEGDGPVRFESVFHHDVWIRQRLFPGGSDFTEMFEAEKKKSIPIGTAVILNKQGLIRAAKKTEIPMGVISVAPAIVCNNADEWPQKHLKNEFGQLLTEEVEEDITTPDGKTERAIVQKPILNPDYDPNREYIPRDQRPEWHPVGLLGQLHLRKGQPVAPSWVKIKDVSENVELWLVK